MEKKCRNLRDLGKKTVYKSFKIPLTRNFSEELRSSKLQFKKIINPKSSYRLQHQETLRPYWWAGATAHVGAGREVGQNTGEANFLWQFWRPCPELLRILGLQLCYFRGECVKPGSGISEVNRMSALQAQDKHRLWEIGKGKKKIRGNLCKTPGGSIAHICKSFPK